MTTASTDPGLVFLERAVSRLMLVKACEMDIETGGCITTTSSNTVVSAPSHDCAWWSEEAGRVGSDWGGIIATHIGVLAELGLIEREAGE